jgi:hypothetical protein
VFDQMQLPRPTAVIKKILCPAHLLSRNPYSGEDQATLVPEIFW